MARKLNTFVHVYDENGMSHAFGPDDDLPDWAEKVITNPDVWADGAGQPASTASTGTGDPSQPPAGGPPPKGGAGSGAPAWREYAAANGVQVAEDASREDVIAALDKADVPTE